MNSMNDEERGVLTGKLGGFLRNSDRLSNGEHWAAKLNTDNTYAPRFRIGEKRRAPVREKGPTERAGIPPKKDRGRVGAQRDYSHREIR